MTREEYIKNFGIELMKEGSAGNLESLIQQQLASHPSGREYGEVGEVVIEEGIIEKIVSGYTPDYLTELVKKTKDNGHSHGLNLKDLMAIYAIWIFTVGNVETVRNPEKHDEYSAKRLSNNMAPPILRYRDDMDHLADDSPTKQFSRLKERIPNKLWYQISNRILVTLSSMNNPFGPTTITRGMALPEEAAKAMKPRQHFNMKNIGSWTTDNGVSAGYSANSSIQHGGVPIIFIAHNCPFGTPLAHLSGFELEREVVVGSRKMFVKRIREPSRGSSTYTIEVVIE